MTQVDARVPFAVRAYVVFVAGMLACFGVFALLPFVLTGAWTFSYLQIANQVGVPGYPFDGIGVLIIMVSGTFVPIVSFLPLLIGGPMLLRGELPPPVRRVLVPAMLAHGLYLAFVFTYGRTILMWIFD